MNALRRSGVLLAAIAALLAVASVAHADPVCETLLGNCPDAVVHSGYEGTYIGHDEPAILFYSGQPGSGNSNTWRLRLPQESPVLPSRDGTGGTWSFQRSVAFWFGMALCETQSYPNPGLPCPANSDSNIKDDSDPSSPNYIGNHVGTGFMELQFYPPGWVPFPNRTSCDPTAWCAAMTVFGFSESLTETNNLDCQDRAGAEWGNFAFITKTGVPQGPPDPLGATDAAFVPDPTKVLFMNAGDQLAISIHDSPAGLVTAIRDLTSGESGSMTASVANAFAHPLFQPTASTCTEERYAFHPMYSTSSEHTRIPWALHTYNVAFSDEIGHFEYCKNAKANTVCATKSGNNEQRDPDDAPCFKPQQSLLIQVGGCTQSDIDFDGTAYQPTWSGTLADPVQDRNLHAESFLFTSPLTGGQNYDRLAFEVSLPAIEFFTGCSIETGDGCVNPPPGAEFYPIYSTRTGPGACGWQEGGTHIPGTANTFGGTSSAEYGPILGENYAPFPQFNIPVQFQNFRNTLSSNPCTSTGRLPS